MLKANWKKLTLNFKRPSGTSRGILTQKESWIISVWDSKAPLTIGKGEASIIKTLSPDWNDNYEQKINEVCENISNYTTNKNLQPLSNFPSIQLAIETALLDLKNGGQQIIFNSDFVTKQKPIPINGLIWMGDKTFMSNQIKEKIDQGFSCIKLKIGAIDFDTELDILKTIRSLTEIFCNVYCTLSQEPLERWTEHAISKFLKSKPMEQSIQKC